MAKFVVRNKPTQLTYSTKLARFLELEFKQKEVDGWKCVVEEGNYPIKIWNFGIIAAYIYEDDTNKIIIRDNRIIPELREMIKRFKSKEPVIGEIQ